MDHEILWRCPSESPASSYTVDMAELIDGPSDIVRLRFEDERARLGELLIRVMELVVSKRYRTAQTIAARCLLLRAMTSEASMMQSDIARMLGITRQRVSCVYRQLLEDLGGIRSHAGRDEEAVEASRQAALRAWERGDRKPRTGDRGGAKRRQFMIRSKPSKPAA